jgi:hypothetical protein
LIADFGMPPRVSCQPSASTTEIEPWPGLMAFDKLAHKRDQCEMIENEPPNAPMKLSASYCCQIPQRQFGARVMPHDERAECHRRRTGRFAAVICIWFS